MTDEDAAYCAAAWASGMSQKELAQIFGFKRPPSISAAIHRFVNWYFPSVNCPRRYPSETMENYEERDGKLVWLERERPTWHHYGDDRKKLIPLAVEEFVYQRNKVIG